MSTSGRSTGVFAAVALGLFGLSGCSSTAVGEESQGSAPATTVGAGITDAAPRTSSAPGAEETDPASAEVEATSVAADSQPGAPTLHQAVAMVLESAEHGPELCLGGAQWSLPPQCGGVPLIGWDWATVDGKQTAGGVTWIDSVVVTGNYDGTSLTVTDVHPPTDADFAGARSFPELRAPCPEPEGGWLAAAADAPTDRGSNLGIGAYMETQPDQVGWFYDQSLNPDIDTTGMNDPHKFIIVALFTGDIDRHQAELEVIWPGALCVAQAERSAAEMEALATDVLAGLSPTRELALPTGVTLQLLSYSPSGEPLSGTVPLDVVVVPAGTQEYFDATYGPGVVVLNAQLRPVT